MALSSEELKKINEQLLKQASIQKKLNEEAGAYDTLMKELKNLHKDIAQAKSQELKQAEIAKRAAKAYNDALTSTVVLTKAQFKELRKIKDLEEAKLGILKEQVNTIQESTVMLTKQLKEATNLRNVFGGIKKDFTAITSTVSKGYSKFKAWSGTFEIDKSIRMSATQMGILGKQTDSFRDSLDKAGQQTASFGVGIGELAKMQADYSEELGRTVMLGQSGLEAMAQMAKSTGLGAEGAAKMAADMENQGYSAERTAEFMNQTLTDSTKLGLNASKVIKNMQSNMKMLNKYNFKGGAKGFAKMAETVTKLGVSMNVVEGMSEKLFDIEGAVDMSAQLQVMGGAWAKLADPFKLMYMARNDMEGLTAELGKAAEASVHFSKETGAFEISSMEMHKLRKVAEQTGVAYEDLATAGKNAAKFTKIKKQMNFGVDKETKEFLESTAKMDKNGNATIEVKGETKLLKTLSTADTDWLKAGIAEKASLKDRAEASQTFDEKLTNIVMQLKQYLLPFVKALDTGLRPIVQKLTDTMSNPKLLEGIKSAAEIAGKVIGTIGKFIANNPATAIVGALASFGLMQAAKWYLNGKALGMGFNSVASAGGGGGGIGGGIGGLGGMLKGGSKLVGGKGTMLGRGMRNMAAGASKGMGGMGAMGGIGIGGMALGGLTEATTDPGSTMNILGNAAADAMTGAALGSFLGPIGTAIGGVIGGVYGGVSAYNSASPEHDAMFGSPIHDGAIGKGHGSDFSKNRGLIQGGKITPIDNKDDLIAMKPNGPVEKTLSNVNSGGSMKIEFGEIRFRFDELKITSPGSPGIAIDMLKDPMFIRNITRMIHSETEKVINGGTNKG